MGQLEAFEKIRSLRSDRAEGPRFVRIGAHSIGLFPLGESITKRRFATFFSKDLKLCWFIIDFFVCFGFCCFCPEARGPEPGKPGFLNGPLYFFAGSQKLLRLFPDCVLFSIVVHFVPLTF